MKALFSMSSRGFCMEGRQQYCDHPRVLRLDQHLQHWWDDLRVLWRDLLDETIPASVGLVRPSPPTGPYRYHQANLIVHQATIDTSVSILTMLFLASISKHLDRGRQSFDLSQMLMILCNMPTSEINAHLREGHVS